MKLPDPLDRPTLTIDETVEILTPLGRSVVYELAGEFERTGGASGLPVIRAGRRFLVPTAALWAWLGLSHPNVAAEHVGDPSDGPHLRVVGGDP